MFIFKKFFSKKETVSEVKVSEKLVPPSDSGTVYTDGEQYFRIVKRTRYGDDVTYHVEYFATSGMHSGYWHPQTEVRIGIGGFLGTDRCVFDSFNGAKAYIDRKLFKTKVEVL